MKLISWNIDSLNAFHPLGPGPTLQGVLDQLASRADIIAIQETKLSPTGPTKKHEEIFGRIFPVMPTLGGPLRSQPARVMPGPFLYRGELEPTDLP